MSVAPPISVVVPAKDAERTIERCLAALARQTLGRERYEIIVVDDGSRDRTAVLAAGLGARVVSLARTGGPGAARNAGIEAARGEIVVFTDADCEPEAGFLEALVRPLDDPETGGTKGSYLTRQRALVARFVQLEYEDRYRRMRGARWIDFVDTYAACFRRADLVRAGGFDVRLRQCQDQELSFRLAAAGVKIRFVEEARTYHLHAERLGSYLRKKYRIAWWKVAVLRRHPRKIASDSHTPQALKLEMPAAVEALGFALAAPALIGLGFPAVLALAPLALGAAAFLALAAPFVVRALARDPAVGLAAPAILFLRDIALAAGLFAGLFRAPRLGAGEAPALPAPAGAAS
jgi:cellulose synthase/poly-beta-1,6-N-acetylglucosamine synthase-like glycosyltransferase